MHRAGIDLFQGDQSAGFTRGQNRHRGVPQDFRHFQFREQFEQFVPAGIVPAVESRRAGIKALAPRTVRMHDFVPVEHDVIIRDLIRIAFDHGMPVNQALGRNQCFVDPEQQLKRRVGQVNLVLWRNGQVFGGCD